jgi:membrane fusion protein (multidrug efflux system)
VLRHLDPGATVSDGTAVYDLADVTPLYTDVNVPERHVARLAPGQIVRLHADSSGETVVARIERIAPSVDVASGTVKVTLAVEEKTRLRPGAFVRVSIVTDTHSGAMVVPRAALVAEGSRWHLFRMNGEDDRVAQVDVVLGYEEGDRVEVAKVVDTDDRLAAGDRVVVVGASALTDGARVLVLDGDAESEEAEKGPETEGTAGASA